MPSKLEITYDILPQPRQVRLDTTTTCNAKCLTCHRFLTKRKGEMPVELINEILKDVGRWNPPLDEIVPVNYGEFMLRRDWLQILRMIANKLPNTQLVLPTNGSMLDEQGVKDLCSIPTLKIINFSLNAFFKETYEQFMGFQMGTIAIIDAAVSMVKVLRPDIMLWVSMVFDPQYQSDLERDYFIEYWKQKGVIPWILAASSCNRGLEIKIPRLEPCRSLFSDIVIGFDRKLGLCCFDAGFTLDMGEYSGNLKEDWFNEKMNEIRTLHNQYRRDSLSLCKVCSYA